MNEELQRITQELQRRGVNVPAPETSFEPSSETTVDPELATIQEELRRRGVLPQAESQPSEYSWWDRAKQLGGGALSAIQEAAMAQAQADPFARQTPRMKGYIKEAATQHQQEKAKELGELDPLGRVLHHGGKFGTGMLMTPIPGGASFKTATTFPQVASALGKNVLMGAGIGGVSGVAQEMGANPLAADIGAAILTPAAVKGIKMTGKAASYPFSPSVRARVAEKEGAKEASKILQQATKGVSNPEEAMNVPKALKDLGSRANAEEAGEAIRKSVAGQLEKHEKTRTKVTQPLYEKIESLEEGLNPSRTNALLEKELKTAKGPIRDTLERVQKELKPNIVSNSQDVFNEKVLEMYRNKNFSPETLRLIQEQFPVKGKVFPKPVEIDNTIKYVSDEIKKAYRSGANKLGKELEGIKSALEEDFKSLPEGLVHREKYAELSKPVSAIKEHRALGKIVEKGEYGKGYKLGAAEIPKEFVNTSVKSIRDSKDLLKQIGKDKKAMESLHGYMNNDIIEKITNEAGKVSLPKLETWRKSHPGAFILYPQLETKLKNVSNAQFMVNQIETKANNLPALEAFQKLPLRILKKLIRKIAGGDLLLNFIHKIKDTAKIEKRDALLQKALADPQVAKMLMTPLKNKGALQKSIEYLARYGPGLTAATSTSQKKE